MMPQPLGHNTPQASPQSSHQSSRQTPSRGLTVAPPDRRYRDRPARRFTPEEIQLDEDLRTLFAAVRDEDGDHPTPEFERVARGDGFPWRILARYVVRAAKRGADEERVLAIVERLTQFVHETFRKYSRRRAA